jgi:protein-arginine kinase activator protein McsA
LFLTGLFWCLLFSFLYCLRSIVHEMTHNRLLRLVVAMESALADGRYEEAAHLRDEYKKVVQQSQTADRKAL